MTNRHPRTDYVRYRAPGAIPTCKIWFRAATTVKSTTMQQPHGTCTRCEQNIQSLGYWYRSCAYCRKFLRLRTNYDMEHAPDRSFPTGKLARMCQVHPRFFSYSVARWNLGSQAVYKLNIIEILRWGEHGTTQVGRAHLFCLKWHHQVRDLVLELADTASKCPVLQTGARSLLCMQSCQLCAQRKNLHVV